MWPSRLCCLLAVAWLATSAQPLLAADDPAAAESGAPEKIELSVSPAAEPRPALKYRLFPGLAERTPGNAATYYYRALVEQKQLPKEYWQQYSDRSDSWLAKDAAKYPAEEV